MTESIAVSILVGLYGVISYVIGLRIGRDGARAVACDWCRQCPLRTGQIFDPETPTEPG